jgi:hypothetical protein
MIPAVSTAITQFVHSKKFDTLDRAWNGITASAVTAQMASLIKKGTFFSPFEYGSDIALHLLNATVSNASNERVKYATLLLNAARVGMVAISLANGCATIPVAIDLFDAIVNHGITLIRLSVQQQEAGEKAKST